MIRTPRTRYERTNVRGITKKTLPMTYSLEKYKGAETRHQCPQCNDKKSLVRYVDAKGDYLADNVGKCNHASGCGYHYPPKDYFRDHPNAKNDNAPIKPRTMTPRQEPQPDYISSDLMKQTMGFKSNLTKFLESLIGANDTAKLIQLYNVGTSKVWEGSTIFWIVDQERKVRSGKIILYDPETGKRNKNVFPPVRWVHKELKRNDFNLVQCFFGLHLLAGNNKPVAIVESEKTAIIATHFLPDYIWLACGGLGNLNKANCSGLQGRDVVLFPDLDGQKVWEQKAKELGFKVSRYLFNRSTEAERGQKWDLADFLIREAKANGAKPTTQEPGAKQPPPEPTKPDEPKIETKDVQILRTFGEVWDYAKQHCPKVYQGFLA